MHLSPTFLNTGATEATFQKSGKQDIFRHVLKSSANIYESSGSHFLELPLEYNQNQTPLTKQDLLQPF